MYRCRPAVPLAVLMCLPVLLFFCAPLTHRQKYLHSALQECSWRRRDVGLHPVLTWRGRCVCACGGNHGAIGWMCVGRLLHCAGGRLTRLHDARHASRCCLLLGSFFSALCFCFAVCVRCSVCAYA
ncbi:hypothetical protein TcG_11556 [Trypanosoma cruzi]|nr:hypothetical protein TcG_11556 [Trypanosoma cruzi]